MVPTLSSMVALGVVVMTTTGATGDVKRYESVQPLLNTLRPRQNGHHFTDDTFNRIFVNENVRISIEFSLKFVPKGSINNIPALVQIMAWCRPGDKPKPLSEPVMVDLLTHICVTRPQWVKDESHGDNFVIDGDTGGCRYDNLRCHQRWQSWHHGESRFPTIRLAHE